MTSSPIVVLDGGAAVKTAVHTDPTDGFGIGFSRFRLSRASRTSLSVSDQHVVSVQLSGPVSVDARLGKLRLQHAPARGSIGISPRHTENAAEIRGPVDGIILRVSPECLALAGAQIARPSSTLVAKMSGTDARLFALSRALEREARTDHRGGLLYWSTLADAVIRHLVAQHLSSSAAPPREGLAPRAVARVGDLVRANLDAPLDLVTLAAAAGCDRFRFARGFRKTTGLTPHRYVTRLRLQQARVLMLAGHHALAEVALMTGFYDQSHMTRWFRRVYGMTPGQALAERVAPDC